MTTVERLRFGSSPNFVSLSAVSQTSWWTPEISKFLDLCSIPPTESKLIFKLISWDSTAIDLDVVLTKVAAFGTIDELQSLDAGDRREIKILVDFFISLFYKLLGQARQIAKETENFNLKLENNVEAMRDEWKATNEQQIESLNIQHKREMDRALSQLKGEHETLVSKFEATKKKLSGALECLDLEKIKNKNFENCLKELEEAKADREDLANSYEALASEKNKNLEMATEKYQKKILGQRDELRKMKHQMRSEVTRLKNERDGTREDLNNLVEVNRKQDDDIGKLTLRIVERDGTIEHLLDKIKKIKKDFENSKTDESDAQVAQVEPFHENDYIDEQFESNGENNFEINFSGIRSTATREIDVGTNSPGLEGFRSAECRPTDGDELSNISRQVAEVSRRVKEVKSLVWDRARLAGGFRINVDDIFEDGMVETEMEELVGNLEKVQKFLRPRNITRRRSW